MPVPPQLSRLGLQGPEHRGALGFESVTGPRLCFVCVRRSGGAPPDSAGLRFGAYTQRARGVFSASKRTWILTSERPLASRKVTAYSCGHCARPLGCRALRFAGEPAAEQREDRRLFRLQVRHLPAQLALGLLLQPKHKLTV
jgi:hypothetical protein